MKIRKGFTLLEMLLYVSLMAIILLVSTGFLSFLLDARVKHQAINEVEQQGIMFSQALGQAIRNANSITSPTIGTTGSALTLAVDAPNNPTVFSLVAGVIKISQAGGVAVDLSNNRVEVSNLSFSNLSRAGTPGIIRFSYTISFVNGASRYWNTYSKDFYGSASLSR